MAVEKKGERLLKTNPATAITNASDALLSIGAKIGFMDSGRLTATMPGGIRSFGEEIQVLIRPHGAQSHLTIISASSNKMTLADWGKNQGNINHFFSALDNLSASTRTSEPIHYSEPEQEPANSLPSKKVFISYRRDDSRYVAGRIYDNLRNEFGSEGIYKDVDSIPLGTDFRQHIQDYISQCDSFVAIIGNDWAVDQNNVNRLLEPNDWVRIEIEIAMELSKQINIIPIFVDDAKVPDNNLLPKSLHEFRYRNGISIRPDPDFHNDMQRLIAGLK